MEKMYFSIYKNYILLRDFLGVKGIALEVKLVGKFKVFLRD